MPRTIDGWIERDRRGHSCSLCGTKAPGYYTSQGDTASLVERGVRIAHSLRPQPTQMDQGVAQGVYWFDREHGLITFDGVLRTKTSVLQYDTVMDIGLGWREKEL
jgi:hypothetical protein